MDTSTDFTTFESSISSISSESIDSSASAFVTDLFDEIEIDDEDSKGYIAKREYDKDGNEIYHENFNGYSTKQFEEMSMADIEKALGHKVKVIK